MWSSIRRITYLEIEATIDDEGNEVEVNTLVLVVSSEVVNVWPLDEVLRTAVLKVVMSVTVVREGVGAAAFAAAC